MKLDKDVLLKHKFWVLLLVSLPLTFGALFLLVTSISGGITQKRNDIKRALTDSSRTILYKTPDDIAKMKHEADIEKIKEKLVHEQAFAAQEALFLWPKPVEDEFNFRSGLFAQKITLKKGDAPAESAKNEDRLIHGVLDEVSGDYVLVTGNDKKTYKFYRSAKLEKMQLEGDTVPDITWEEFVKKGSKGTRIAVAFHKGKYFYEPLTVSEQSAYKLNGVYLSQIDPILSQVEPMTAKGEGVVQLRGWAYEKGKLPPGKQDQGFLNFLEQGWVNADGDISEEAWLAQEDLWIQTELYRLIRLANDYVSHFDNVDKNDTGNDKTKVHTFKNPFFEVGLKWSGGNKLNVALKNLQNRKQSADVKFKIRFNQAMEPEVKFIGGEPLGPAGTKEAVRELVLDLGDDNPARKGIYGLDQVLTWETAAVKRIDQITIGSQAPDEIALCNRLFPEGQVALKKSDAPAVVQPVVPPPGPPVTRRPVPRGIGPKGANIRRGAAGNGDNELTKHGLIRNRYLGFSAQSRRIPVALTLIVDQDHIDRVQTAFSNSKLRFLTTQVTTNRYPGSVRPQVIDPDAQANGIPFRPGLFRPGRNPVPQPVVPAGTDDMETNIEMVIYGIVTLYERYPPPLTAEVK